jgi:tetratricopeptide (TPR) repeat protein
MARCLLTFLLAAAAIAEQPQYEIAGKVEPGTRVSVSIYGATTPFSDDTVSDAHGRFRFRKLLRGSYTLAIFAPGRGEARVTVDVGPGSANKSGRVEVTLNLRDSDFAFNDIVERNAVSARQLTVPERAWREYERARKDLGRRDVDDARAHLQKATEIAPQFATAWNTLGTIEYQTQHYSRAEQCFREALAQNASEYEALVNLGGVLINLNRLKEAREFNQRAVSIRPNDALANSQLGMTYFELGEFAPAEKYLQRAVEIDPAHFSHPQLILAQIHARENNPQKAADDLESFLQHHPDWPDAAKLKTAIATLRAR